MAPENPRTGSCLLPCLPRPCSHPDPHTHLPVGLAAQELFWAGSAKYHLHTKPTVFNPQERAKGLASLAGITCSLCSCLGDALAIQVKNYNGMYQSELKCFTVPK